MSFEFIDADLAYSNLGGQGPDDSSWAPEAIRYVNVGKKFIDSVGTVRFDLEVTAYGAYSPYNSSLNTIAGRFAQINLAANQQVALRATVKRSCSTADSCSICNELSSFAERVHCYGQGCSCVGVTVVTPAACGSAEKEAYRRAYDCSWASDTLVLPSTVCLCVSPRVVSPAHHITCMCSAAPTRPIACASHVRR